MKVDSTFIDFALADTPIAQRQADAREILAYRDDVLAFCRDIVQGD